MPHCCANERCVFPDFPITCDDEDTIRTCQQCGGQCHAACGKTCADGTTWMCPTCYDTTPGSGGSSNNLDPLNHHQQHHHHLNHHPLTNHHPGVTTSSLNDNNSNSSLNNISPNLNNPGIINNPISTSPPPPVVTASSPHPSSSGEWICNGVDITIPHPLWIGRCRPFPGKSVWWKAYHATEGNAPNYPAAVCNLCGDKYEVKGSTGSASRHLERKHLTVYHYLKEKEMANNVATAASNASGGGTGGKSSRKRASTSSATTSATGLQHDLLVAKTSSQARLRRTQQWTEAQVMQEVWTAIAEIGRPTGTRSDSWQWSSEEWSKLALSLVDLSNGRRGPLLGPTMNIPNMNLNMNMNNVNMTTAVVPTTPTTTEDNLHHSLHGVNATDV